MRKDKHPEKAVVLLSGGLDSATTLAIANNKGHDVYALTFDYKQRHARELESARSVASALAVKKHLIIDFSLREIGGSALTSELKVPKKGIRDSGMGAGKGLSVPNPITQPPIPVTYVPARNTIFLSFALAWAEVLQAGLIYIGANVVDYSGYPDCRPEYLRAFEKMANLAAKAAVEGDLHFHLRAPLISMTKAEIIKKGLELGLDYSLTWSCYDPQLTSAKSLKFGDEKTTRNIEHRTSNSQTDVIPCGRCDSCRLRKKGFKEAGVKDPLISQ